MEAVHALGRFSSWFTNGQVDQHFAITRAPLFLPLFDTCMRTFPDGLDIQETGYATIPSYLLAGFIDYGIISILVGWYRAFSLLWIPKSNRSLHILTDPAYGITRIALLLSFIYHAKNFGLDNLRDVCNLETVRWSEMRKLNVLILLLCPALWCHYTFDMVMKLFSLDQNQPWLSTIYWYILSANWDVATLRSNMVYFTSAKATTDNNVKARDSYWTDLFWSSCKYAIIASLGEALIWYMPTMAVIAVIAMQHIAQGTEQITMSWIYTIQDLAPFKQYLVLEKFVTMKRDTLILALVRLFRQMKLYNRFLGVCENFLPSGRDLERLAWSSVRILDIPFHYITKRLRQRYSNYAFLPSKLSTGERRIRLLQVFPSFSNHDAIRGSLAWYDFEAAPAYTAVSYVWGSSERSSSIVIDGQEFKTTLSAREALRGLRSHWRREYFWIDAICIDQNDNQDKAEQISFMADIYKNANMVVVWLGPTAHGAQVLGLIRRLWIKIRVKSKLPDLPFTAHASKDVWQALRDLLQNDWFERSWVVQEVLSSNVIVQYGHARIDWITFSMFAMAISNDVETMQRLWPSKWKIRNVDRSSSLEKLSKIKHIRSFEEFRCIDARRGVGEHDHLSLLYYLVRMFRSDNRFKATETKDRIYALVNLCGLAGQPQFRSDYKPFSYKIFTETDLFMVVAHHLLTTGIEARRLDLLAHAGIANNLCSKQQVNLPSWVPDWSSANISRSTLPGQDGMNEVLRHPRLKGILEAFADLRSVDEVSYSDRPKYQAELAELMQSAQVTANKTLYHATADTLPRMTIHEQPKHLLELEGIYLDDVETIGPAFPSVPLHEISSTTLDDVRKLSQVLLDYAKPFLSGPRPGWGDIASNHNISELGRVLLGDLSDPTFDFALPRAPIRPAPGHRIGYVCVYLTMHYASLNGRFDLNALLNGQIDRLELKKLFGNLLSPLDAKEIFYDIHEHISTVCVGRAFGLTSQGTMCMFPQGTKVKDTVCLFMGADLPYIVRPAGRELISNPTKQGMSTSSTLSEKPENMTAGTLAISDQKQTPLDEKREMHTLIGSAYVHGFMDGEGLTGQPRRTFLLR